MIATYCGGHHLNLAFRNIVLASPDTLCIFWSSLDCELEFISFIHDIRYATGKAPTYTETRCISVLSPTIFLASRYDAITPQHEKTSKAQESSLWWLCVFFVEKKLFMCASSPCNTELHL